MKILQFLLMETTFRSQKHSEDIICEIFKIFFNKWLTVITSQQKETSLTEILFINENNKRNYSLSNRYRFDDFKNSCILFICSKFCSTLNRDLRKPEMYLQLIRLFNQNYFVALKKNILSLRYQHHLHYLII